MANRRWHVCPKGVSQKKTHESGSRLRESVSCKIVVIRFVETAKWLVANSPDEQLDNLTHEASKALIQLPISRFQGARKSKCQCIHKSMFCTSFHLLGVVHLPFFWLLRQELQEMFVKISALQQDPRAGGKAAAVLRLCTSCLESCKDLSFAKILDCLELYSSCRFIRGHKRWKIWYFSVFSWDIYLGCALGCLEHPKHEAFQEQRLWNLNFTCSRCFHGLQTANHPSIPNHF